MLNQLLDRLHKVRPAGKDKWTACCPVHNDRTPSMSIRDAGDAILMHCHACQADGLDVVKALGLPFKILFKGAELGGDRVPNSIMDKAETALCFIDLYEQEQKRGSQLTLKEKREHRRALQLRKTYDDNKGRNTRSPLDNVQIERGIPQAFR